MIAGITVKIDSCPAAQTWAGRPKLSASSTLSLKVADHRLEDYLPPTRLLLKRTTCLPVEHLYVPRPRGCP